MRPYLVVNCFISLFLLFLLSGVPNYASRSEAAEAKGEDAALSIQAWDYYYDKDFDKASDLFNKELTLHFDWCDPYDGLGWCYLQKGDFKKAEDNFKKALKIYQYYQNSLAGMQEVNLWKYRVFNRAWGYYYAGNFAKAIELFENVLNPKVERLPKEEFWLAHSGLAWAYFGNKNYDSAIEHFNEVLKTQRDNADSLKGLGLSYFEKGFLDNAISNLQNSLNKVSYQPDAQSKIAWAYGKKGSFSRAVEEFEKAKKLNPYLAEPYKGLAWTYLEMKDYNKAKENFVQGIKIYPGYVADAKFKDILKTRGDWKDIYPTLGWSYYGYGLYKLAAEEFENALKTLGEDAEALRGKGYALYKLADYDKAIEYLKKSLSKNPDLAPVEEYVQVPGTIATYLLKSDAQTSIGWVLYYKGKYRESIEEFKKAQQRHPDWMDIPDGLGWAYFMLKDYKNAEQSFRGALNFNPGYADALNGITAVEQVKYGKSGLGWSYFYRGDYKTALKQFEDVVRGKDTEFPKEQLWSIHNGMAWCHYWLGNPGGAEDGFRKVLNEKKDNIDALVGLGYVLYQRKSYGEAINNLNEALKLVPASYDALTTLGWSYYKTGDPDSAIKAFKAAIAINSYLVDPYLGLGLSLYKNKDLANAKISLGTAIDIYPDYCMTDEFKEILNKQKDWLDLYSRLGWSYYYKGVFDKAAEMFATVLKKDPSSKDALMGLGSIYFQKQDYKSAIGKLEPLLADKPESEKGWYKWSYVLSNLGWSYFYGANYDKALDYFRQLAALHKGDDIYADPHSGIGWCLLKKGDKTGAKDQFLMAIKLLPGQLSAVKGLAELDRLG